MLDLKTYFNGELVAHGIFTDRSGKVRAPLHRADDRHLAGQPGHAGRSASPTATARPSAASGASPTKATAATPAAPTTWSARPQGRAAGNALNWRYTLRLPVDGSVYEVQFDDWMYLMDERVMLNKAVMSKFGIRLGEVTLAFYKNMIGSPCP